MMHFGQQTHPLNFEYGEQISAVGEGFEIHGNSFKASIHCQEIGDFCVRLRIDNSNVIDKRVASDAVLEEWRVGHPVAPDPHDSGGFRLDAGTLRCWARGLSFRTAAGFGIETTRENGIGFSGDKLLLNFHLHDARAVYGFGERTGGLNKIGSSMDFWNVDVVAVHPHAFQRTDYDPSYVSIPLALIACGPEGQDGYIGIYCDNPGRAVVDCARTRPGQLMYQSMTGNTDLYLFSGSSLREVVRKFARLTGRAEMPPLWSMGYHQSRWGYAREVDFVRLQKEFERFDIPVSVFWYDIDYMDGYRLFTWNREAFPAPLQLNERLKASGIRVVTIIEPGIKREAGYGVYERGKDHYCVGPTGREYVGRVWPGDVVFPDFTQPSVRNWWSGELAAFLRASAVDGAWLDMNDPATGFSATEEMQFEHGRVPHDRQHNQYAHWMARAAKLAFERMHSQARPFLLTRSASTGTQRYSAVWTGDNVSSWQHLRMSIPQSLNLSLSGIAFNGPDVGGFMGHTQPELLIRWFQAALLFPLFRNHSIWDSKAQEPWAFGPRAAALIGAAIRTRYRLLPYLYQCFFEHYLTGDPILRPLCYEFADPDFATIDDQFMVGSSLLVAPVMDPPDRPWNPEEENPPGQIRHITLPEGWWFDLNRGEWIPGGRILRYSASMHELPMFARDGAIIPYFNGPLNNSLQSLEKLELHAFVHTQPGALTYYVDDHETRAYQRDLYNRVDVCIQTEDKSLRAEFSEAGPLPPGGAEFTVVLYGLETLQSAEFVVDGTQRQCRPQLASRRWLNKDLPVLVC